MTTRRYEPYPCECPEEGEACTGCQLARLEIAELYQRIAARRNAGRPDLVETKDEVSNEPAA